MSGLELHIDELVLHGFRVDERDRVSSELASELVRLLTEDGAVVAGLRSDGDSVLDGGARAVGESRAGPAIAHAIHGALTR